MSEHTGSDLSHCIFVGALRGLIRTLQDGDELHPNAVGNLTIVHNEIVVGYIDLLRGHGKVVMFDGDPNEVANV